MDDRGMMNREWKKKQLRNNIVKLPQQNAGHPEYAEEDSEAVIQEAHKKRRNKRLKITLAVLIFTGLLAYSGYRYQEEYQYMEYSVVWEKPMRFEEQLGTDGEETDKIAGETGFVNFVNFCDNMIKYTKDGASYIDASGKTIWTQSYEMKSPIIYINGEYAAIADQQGNDIYICNKEGSCGVAKTQLPITKVSVSAKGVVAAIVEDSTAAYIFYFKKDGSTLGIDVKMLLSGDGYPIDMALSPDGKQIVLSVMYMKNGTLKNKVVFYDFSEIGKNVNNRFVGGFESEFDDKIAARVRYLNQDTVAAFTDKGIVLISVKDVIPDTDVISIPVEETIESIFYSEKYAGVVVDNSSGGSDRADVYRTDGSLAASFEFDFPYSGIRIDGDRVILYNDESIQMYDLKGHLKFEHQMESQISNVRLGKQHRNSLIIAGGEVMQSVRLK